MSIQKDIDETYTRLEQLLKKANTKVNYSQRFLFKMLIRINNQIRKPTHIQAAEAEARFWSNLFNLGLYFWDPEVGERYKILRDKSTSEPVRKLEAELDKANMIIDSIKWKELLPFYKDSKHLGLTQANNYWMPKIKLPKYKVIRYHEKNPDDQNN
jgi:hypothetical protein